MVRMVNGEYCKFLESYLEPAPNCPEFLEEITSTPNETKEELTVTPSCTTFVSVFTNVTNTVIDEADLDSFANSESDLPKQTNKSDTKKKTQKKKAMKKKNSK